MSKQRIVVGVDGSPESRDALLWAAEQARAVGGLLRIVHAWSPPGVVALGLPPILDWEPLREHAKEFPGAFAREVLGEDPDVEIVSAAVLGNAAQVLVDASEQADLLVVGSRGLGGLKGMLLGSVGHHCAAHARCPVVIVHRPPLRKRRAVRRETLGAAQG
jgi:nucleotide-binding universal stress UspA family protein